MTGRAVPGLADLRVQAQVGHQSVRGLEAGEIPDCGHVGTRLRKSTLSVFTFASAIALVLRGFDTEGTHRNEPAAMKIHLPCRCRQTQEPHQPGRPHQRLENHPQHPDRPLRRPQRRPHPINTITPDTQDSRASLLSYREAAEQH